jgi:tetratricopeptide (TPR) repeat protein
MTLARWIAVATVLIAAPVFAQPMKLPLSPTAANATNAESSANSTRSLNEELEGLRREIAATKELREQVAAEARQPVETETLAIQKQRHELLELLAKLATSKPPTPPAAAEPVKSIPSTTTGARKPEAGQNSTTDHPLITDKIVDPLSLGHALFRTGDYVGAEQAYRKVKVTDENRVLLQYLIANCLRRQSRWEQAAKAYRIVSENKTDPALREMALWQLESIRWHQQTESQLEQLRELRGASNASKKPSPSASRAEEPR